MKINYEDYFIVTATNSEELHIGINLSGKLVIHQKLMTKLESNSVKILLANNYQSIILSETDANQKLPKSGSINIEPITKQMVKNKMSLPVKYVMRWDIDNLIWYGELIKQTHSNNNVRKKAKVTLVDLL